MSKFNQPNQSPTMEKHPDATTNYEGGLAFTLSPEMELYTRASTWIMKNKFYDPESKHTETAIDQLVEKVANTNPRFFMQLLVYLRNAMYLRSAPTYLLALACKYPETKKLVKEYTPLILRRADEILEVLAAYSFLNPDASNRGHKSIAHALKKGISDTLSSGQFNTYQLAKYEKPSGKATWTFRDVLRLLHVKPASEMGEVFRAIAKSELRQHDTWENEISEKGSDKESWEAVMPKMGIFALVRNIRNFLKHGCDISRVHEQLKNSEVVSKSKMFPFRFLTAYRIVEKLLVENEIKFDPFVAKEIKASLEKAIDLSVSNLPMIGGRSVIATDLSASMNQPIAGKRFEEGESRSFYHRCRTTLVRPVSCMDIGALMSAIASGFCETSYNYVFGAHLGIVDYEAKDSVMSIVNTILNSDVGHSTYGYLVLKHMTENNIKADRLLLFTDEEMYHSDYSHTETVVAWLQQYRAKVNPNLVVYTFNLAGYGTTQVPEDDPHACLMAGWSEKVFDLMVAFEKDRSKAVQEIMNYHI